SSLCRGWSLPSRQFSFSQPSEDHGSHNQHMQQRADHASEYGRRERLHHFGPGARGPHNRYQTRNNGGHGHDFGTQTQQGTFHYRFAQSLYGKHSHSNSFSFHGLFQVDHHHHAGLHSSAE